VILTVRDASRAQAGLSGSPGRLTVLDEKTVYLRLPKSFMESDTLLMILRNLLKAAWEKENAVLAPVGKRNGAGKEIPVLENGIRGM